VTPEESKVGDPSLAARGGEPPATCAQHAGAGAFSSPREEAAPSGGRFQILHPHAKGGLGEVFLAHDRELHREVALKEIRAEHVADEDMRARFLMEAEITGGLEHPGVVPVYGLGQYPDGRPFYAMRFIRGQSLREAIQRFHVRRPSADPSGEQKLLLGRLLRVFVDVCNTVAYAHSRGVLHRDLKPDNVMLGPYGETLVVDWGLAKLVQAEEEAVTEAGHAHVASGSGSLRPAISTPAPTQYGTAVGTLGYMSPEQAAGLVDQLGPASDVFSLGAILYTILTGKTSLEDVNSSDWWQATILGRFAPPRKLDPGVAPPLEAICLKAMALDPAQRYGSARELAEDIEAWLADQPVRAWREPWRVRAGRWMRRHRTLVSGAAAALLVALVSLGAGVILLTDANRRVRASRDLAEKRQEDAQRNFRMARTAVDGYLTRVSQDPRLKAHGLEGLRRTLLETAGGFYEKFVQQQPDDADLQWERAWACFRLSEITREVGSKRQALELLDRAQEAFQSLALQYPDNDTYESGVVKCRTQLGILHLDGGRQAEARTVLEEALTKAADLARRHPDVAGLEMDLASIHHSLAKLYIDAKEFDRAEAAYQSALAARRRLAGMNPEAPEFQAELAGTESNLGLLYHLRGRLREAETALSAARDIQQRLVKKHGDAAQYQSDLAATCNNLASLYADLPGRQSDAEGAYRMALEVRQRLAREHSQVAEYRRDLARSHNNLATLYCKHARLREAEEAYHAAELIQQDMADQEPEVPEYRNDLAATLNNLGNLYADAEQPDHAETAYRGAIAIRQRLAVQHPENPDYQNDLATTYNNLGTLCMLAGRLDEADVVYQAALKIRQRLAEKYPQAAAYTIDLATTSVNLGHLAIAQDRPKAALDYCTNAKEALDGRSDVAGHPAARQTLENAHRGCAEALERLGQPAEAIAEWDRAIALATDHRSVLRLERAAALARTGNHVRAADEAAQLITAAGEDGPSLYRLATVLSTAAGAAARDASLAEGERNRLAEQYAIRAIELLRKAQRAGYFKEPAARARLKDDPALAPLRLRKEFQELQ